MKKMVKRLFAFMMSASLVMGALPAEPLSGWFGGSQERQVVVTTRLI